MATQYMKTLLDLRDVPCMPLDVSRLLTLNTWLAAADDPIVGFALMNLWMRAWHQVPAGSLPSDDSLLARLAMCTKSTWSRIKAAALADWSLDDDGRYYHAVIVEKAAECADQRAKKAAFAELQRAKGIASAAARKARGKSNVKPTETLPVLMKSDVPAALVEVSTNQVADKVFEARQDNAEIVFEFWKETMKSKRSIFDAKRRKLINQRLKDGYTVDDLKKAIHGCSMTPHNMGQTNGTLYNTIELILRDSSYIDRFMSTAMGTKELFARQSGVGLSDKAKKSFDAITRSLKRNRKNDDGKGEIA
jgi:uncharacterized protein YdaU (DUF1376 family)